MYRVLVCSLCVLTLAAVLPAPSITIKTFRSPLLFIFTPALHVRFLLMTLIEVWSYFLMQVRCCWEGGNKAEKPNRGKEIRRLENI